jgi:hypothetical protein
LDAHRRDFTINCIYYFHNYSIDTEDKVKKIKDKIILNEKMLEVLTKSGTLYIPDLELMILQDHDTIEKTFEK